MKSSLCLIILFLVTAQAFAGPREDRDGRDKLRSLQQQEAVRSGLSSTQAQELRMREDSLRKQRWQQRQDNSNVNESPSSNKWRNQWKNGPRSQND